MKIWMSDDGGDDDDDDDKAEMIKEMEIFWRGSL